MRNWMICLVLLWFVPAAPVFAKEKAATAAVEHVKNEVSDAMNPDAKPETGEVVEAAGELVGAAKTFFVKGKDEAGEQTRKAGAWALIVAAALKLLLMLLKLTGPFWGESKGKWVLRAICLVVGLVFGVISYIGLGYEWHNAVITVFSGPGAILITEFQKMIPALRKKEA